MSIVAGTSLRFHKLPGRRSADPLAAMGATSSMRVVELERSSRRTAHRHSHSEEVIYVVAGKGSVWIKGEVTMVGVGDRVHVPAGILHATVPDPGETMRLVCFFPHPDLVNNAEETDMEVSPDGEGER